MSEMLERDSGISVDRSLAADEAVAQGAAIYAGLLRNDDDLPLQRVEITNVNSHSLGALGKETKTGRNRNRVLIPQNTPLPTKSSARFETRRDDQRSVVVAVIEGGDASGNNSTPIGRCVVRELPPNLPAGTKVKVEFSYKNNGQLTVDASLPGIERKARLVIERASGLSESKVDEWGKRVADGMKPLNMVSALATGDAQPSSSAPPCDLSTEQQVPTATAHSQPDSILPPSTDVPLTERPNAPSPDLSEIRPATISAAEAPAPSSSTAPSSTIDGSPPAEDEAQVTVETLAFTEPLSRHIFCIAGESRAAQSGRSGTTSRREHAV